MDNYGFLDFKKRDLVGTLSEGKHLTVTCKIKVLRVSSSDQNIITFLKCFQVVSLTLQEKIYKSERFQSLYRKKEPFKVLHRALEQC